MQLLNNDLIKINTYHLIEGAKKATGLTVIMDVFRAFSLECYLYNMGVSLIRPVGTLCFQKSQSQLCAYRRAQG